MKVIKISIELTDSIGNNAIKQSMVVTNVRLSVFILYYISTGIYYASDFGFDWNNQIKKNKIQCNINKMESQKKERVENYSQV